MSIFIRCFLIFTALTALLHGGENEHGLRFFVVSSQPAAGLHLIDTKQFPKLGYISDKPDLIFTELKGVVKDTARYRGGTFNSATGKFTPDPPSLRPALIIDLTDDESAAFAGFAARNVGNQVVLMLGDLPLTAPVVEEAIRTPSLQITLSDKDEQERIYRTLETLVKSPPSAPKATH